MKMIGIKTIVCVLMLASFQPSSYSQTSKATLSADEIELYEMIMDHRESMGLEKIPLSNSLTIVAQTHSQDLADNKPDLHKNCNGHSWSDKGSWSSCCYTADHKQSSCMWSKPKELTSYRGSGFEISVGSSEPAFDDYVMTPEYAISSWKSSIHHNNVIVNKGVWKSMKWNAIGIGIYKGFATVWFGENIDPDGEPNKK